MLCSLQLSFPSTSAPHWLDRLHSTLPSASPFPPPCPPRPPPATAPAALSAALSDLFHFGDPPARPHRAPRKQPFPRSCARTGSEAGSSASRRRRSDDAKARAKKRPASAPVEGDKGGRFSRTDVVVIDTSGGETAWKSGKVVLRKGSVWKVRDKKLWNMTKRRRRLTLVERRERAAGAGSAEGDRSVSVPPNGELRLA